MKWQYSVALGNEKTVKSLYFKVNFKIKEFSKKIAEIIHRYAIWRVL